MLRQPPFYEIEKFYVQARAGLYYHGRVLEFGEPIDCLTDFAANQLYVRKLIGSHEQVQASANKYGLVFNVENKKNDAQVIKKNERCKSI
ncbi:hypothetical protein [Silvanigrella sp.]|jgi:hypothetical protein|uniref:hypothetical protein n=1 Tax=Silvanigrella sp. TaxID=2024976 RepID=UPI0037C90AC1